MKTKAGLGNSLANTRYVVANNDTTAKSPKTHSLISDLLVLWWRARLEIETAVALFCLYERRVLDQLTVDRGFYLRFKLSIYAMIF